MAIESKLHGSIFSNEYKRILLPYKGSLKDFTHSITGLRPNTRYFVGFSFDSTDGGMSGMTVNGTIIGYSYTAGFGSFRKSSGTGSVAVGNGGILTFTGGSGATTGIAGALVLFYVPIAS